MVMLFVFMINVGMGSFGDQRSVEAPEPDRLYAATLVDQTDVSMKLNKVSCNGQTFVLGYLGRSQLSIDFEKISSILFFVKQDKILASIALRDGDVVELIVEDDIPWHGVSSYADVRIETRDIKKITLHQGNH